MEDLKLAEGYQPEAVEAPAPRRRGRAFIVTVLQLFVLPLGIVIVCTASYVGVRWLTFERTTPEELLRKIGSKGASSEWRPSHQARWQAAFELYAKLREDEEARKDPALVPGVIKALESPDLDGEIRKYLAGILGFLEAREGVPALVRALKDPHGEVRIYSAVALGKIGDPGAVPSLVPLLADEDPAVRAAAFYSLGWLGGPVAVEALKGHLQDPHEGDRWKAALALASLGDASGVEVITRMLDRDYVTRLIQDADETGDAEAVEEQVVWRMVNAARGVGKLKESSLEAPLVLLSENDRSVLVRKAALEALADLRE